MLEGLPRTWLFPQYFVRNTQHCKLTFILHSPATCTLALGAARHIQCSHLHASVPADWQWECSDQPVLCSACQRSCCSSVPLQWLHQFLDSEGQSDPKSSAGLRSVQLNTQLKWSSSPVVVQVQSIEVSIRFNLSFSVNPVTLQFVDSGWGKIPLHSRVVDDQPVTPLAQAVSAQNSSTWTPQTWVVREGVRSVCGRVWSLFSYTASAVFSLPSHHSWEVKFFPRKKKPTLPPFYPFYISLAGAGHLGPFLSYHPSTPFIFPWQEPAI